MGFARVLCSGCNRLLLLATPGSTISIKCRGCKKHTVIALPPLDTSAKRVEADHV